MRTHVALLRGINVLGRNQVSMADLRAVVESLGHGDVATYIQSGNVVFSAADPRDSLQDIAERLEEAVADRLTVRPAVMVVGRDQLGRVVADNPFPGEGDHRRLHAVFFKDDADAARTGVVAAAVERAREKGSRDDATFVGGVLYLWTPDGFGRSILRAELSRRSAAPMSVGTARNWATVSTLLTMLG